MARQNALLQAFNRGVVSLLALARIDLARMALSAEEQFNWMPRTLGSMMLRVGQELIAQTDNGEQPKYLDFVHAVDDTALVEITDGTLRAIVDDAPVYRVPVSTTIANGDPFVTGLTSWTANDDAGSSSSFSSPDMKLTGTTFGSARRYQAITVASYDQNKEHAINLHIARGNVKLRIGTTSSGQDILAETTLGTGYHSLSFTPTTGTAYIQLVKTGTGSALVRKAKIESYGIMRVDVPYTVDDLQYLRKEQSGDVLFVACKNRQQMKIERRSETSWSAVYYEPSSGPFRPINNTAVTMQSTVLNGDGLLNSSQPFFKTAHVGALFKLDSLGQAVSATLIDEEQYSNPIRVTGVGTTRLFNYAISGTFVGTVTLQRSIGDIGAWEDVVSYTAPVSTSLNDGFDNQIIYYRLGIKSGNYTSGTVNVSINYAIGSISGVARVTNYVSETQVGIVVLTDFGSTSSTLNWYEGEWSDYRGWPSAVALYESRLWWAGKDKNWGSVVDSFENFDDDVVGDSGPISRSIGSGPVDTVNWILPLQRLILGGQGAEHSVRSSSFDEPLTPTNYNLKQCSTQGSSNVPGLKIDSTGIFVGRTRTRVFEMTFGGDPGSGYDYGTVDMSLLCPEICEPGVIATAIQRKPDTRVHCVLDDGTAAILVYDHVENIRCWIKISPGDIDQEQIVDVVVLPEGVEDAVYYVVKSGSTHYLVKNAYESECQGGTLNLQADMFVKYSGTPISTLTGLSHLEGREVVVWADGKARANKTVSGGQISLGASYSNVVAGLWYEARYKSTKLAYAAQNGTALCQRKRVTQLGIILHNTHPLGLKFGPDYDTLDPLPGVEREQTVDPDEIYGTYDEDAIEFPGEWDTDSRVCLYTQAPFPTTVLAMVVTVQTNENL